MCIDGGIAVFLPLRRKKIFFSMSSIPPLLMKHVCVINQFKKLRACLLRYRRSGHALLIDSFLAKSHVQIREAKLRAPSWYLDYTKSELVLKKVADTFEDFKPRFEGFTQGRLKSINWANTLVIGGAVTIPLFHEPPAPGEVKMDDYSIYRTVIPLCMFEEPTFFLGENGYSAIIGRAKLFREQLEQPDADLQDFLKKYYLYKFASSDIDIYIYGLDLEAAKKKVRTISPL